MMASVSPRQHSRRLLNAAGAAFLFATAWIVVFAAVLDFPAQDWPMAIGVMYVLWWGFTQVVVLATLPVLQYLARRIRSLSRQLNIPAGARSRGSAESHPIIRAAVVIFALGVFFLSLGGALLAASPALAWLGFSELPDAAAASGLILLAIGFVGWAALVSIPLLAFVLASLLVAFIHSSLESIEDLSDDLSARKTLTRSRGILELLIP